mmetsp:Transcript_11161/g.26010  ORF Transcript_11161/g.26010 Transcript_11161/m.26010 type:complete len:400 (-) Transcript_11161:81-1280(-)
MLLPSSSPPISLVMDRNCSCIAIAAMSPRLLPERPAMLLATASPAVAPATVATAVTTSGSASGSVFGRCTTPLISTAWTVKPERREPGAVERTLVVMMVRAVVASPLAIMTSTTEPEPEGETERMRTASGDTSAMAATAPMNCVRDRRASSEGGSDTKIFKVAVRSVATWPVVATAPLTPTVTPTPNVNSLAKSSERASLAESDDVANHRVASPPVVPNRAWTDPPASSRPPAMTPDMVTATAAVAGPLGGLAGATATDGIGEAQVAGATEEGETEADAEAIRSETVGLRTKRLEDDVHRVEAPAVFPNLTTTVRSQCPVTAPTTLTHRAPVADESRCVGSPKAREERVRTGAPTATAARERKRESDPLGRPHGVFTVTELDDANPTALSRAEPPRLPP